MGLMDIKIYIQKMTFVICKFGMNAASLIYYLITNILNYLDN